MTMKSFGFGVLAGCLLCSCAHKTPPSEVEAGKQKAPKITAEQAKTAEDAKKQPKTVEELYALADTNMKKKSFKAAAKGFEKVIEEYPYSSWAIRAQIMEPYCRYQAHQYADAIDGFTIFVRLHPHHKDAAYAQYMVGLSHYERISIVERDQEDTINALKAFYLVLTMYPTSQYAKDAKFKIDFLQNHLASKEMDVGRTYQKEKSYISAINRFATVVTQYATTEQCPEALFRLTECYAILNMRDEFIATYKVLKQNHKKSEWFSMAKHLYKTYIKRVPNQSEKIIDPQTLKMEQEKLKQEMLRKAELQKQAAQNQAQKTQKEAEKGATKQGILETDEVDARFVTPQNVPAKATSKASPAAKPQATATKAQSVTAESKAVEAQPQKK